VSTHVAVWIDHKDGTETLSTVAPRTPHHDKHPDGPEGRKEHPDDAKRFFDEVARTVDDGDKLLLVGPASAKLEFMRYLHSHERALEPKVVAVETVDHPTDGQFVAYAKSFFAKSSSVR
jgi:stalled ribosome rescue protein Dom34